MKFSKFLKFLSLSIVLSFMTVSCEQDVTGDNNLSANFVGLTRANSSVNLEENQTVDVEAKVIASKSFNYDRVIALELIYTSPQNTVAAPNTVPVTNHDPQYFTAPTSVTIPAGETEATFTVNVTGTNLGNGKNIVLAIVPQEGIEIDTRFFGTRGSATYEIQSSRLVLKLQPICNLNPLRIDISIDRYGAESSWELYDANDLTAPIAEGGPYTNASANGVRAQAPFDICLADGNYVFVMYDSYGDGMNSGAGAGFYKLSQMNATWSTVVNQIAQNGTFASNDIVEFSLPFVQP